MQSDEPHIAGEFFKAWPAVTKRSRSSVGGTSAHWAAITTFIFMATRAYVPDLPVS